VPEIRVPYGKGFLSAAVAYDVVSIAPRPVDPAPDPLAVVEAALDAPVGGRKLDDFGGARSAAIAINDKTRPVPHSHLLPPLLNRLHRMGIPAENITFVIATGTHSPMPPEEFERILPSDIIRRYRVISHDAYDDSQLVDLGATAHGTPVLVNRHYLAADLHLVVGNIEPHQFMGFSGGVKGVAVGVAAFRTINHNHALMSHPNSQLGHYDDNPTRQDVEEIGRMIRVDFTLNALLNGQKQIVEMMAGDPVAVMQAGIPRVRAIFQVEVDEPFDLVIASPGGHPKDINLYQAQKALGHAALITRTGGAVILVAACPEGTGSQRYEDWVLGMTSQAAVIERFQREGFRLGAHKAFQLARDGTRVRVILVSDMALDFVRRLLLQPATSLSDALGQLALPPDARVAVMPAANATIPALKEGVSL
jgi:nickel-dependent lactate racemase